MASSKEFRDFILEQLRELEDISFRPMMGEFMLYYNGILFGGIYDDRFLIKETYSNKGYGLKKEIPYEHGRPMYMVENLEEPEYLRELIETTCHDLVNQKRGSK